MIREENKSEDGNKSQDGIKSLISLIVPVYRTQAYLDRCVQSILNQTYPHFELLLIDDGSPDQSGAMCDEYAKRDQRVRVLHKENGGLVSAWQAGVTMSKGEYLCFVDSDDWIDLEMLADMTEKITGVSDEVICCNFIIERKQGQEKRSHGAAPGIYEGKQLERLKDRLLGNENRTISLSRCMKLCARKMIEENMKYSDPKIKMGEDVNIMTAAMLDAGRVVIMKDAYFYHYFYNEESMVHRYVPELYGGISRLYGALAHIYQEKNRADGDRQCGSEYQLLLLLALKNEIRGNTKNCFRTIPLIAGDTETRRCIDSTPVQVYEKAGRILYKVLRKPAKWRIAAAVAVFWVYDRLRQ